MGIKNDVFHADMSMLLEGSEYMVFWKDQITGEIQWRCGVVFTPSILIMQIILDKLVDNLKQQEYINIGLIKLKTKNDHE